MKTLNKLLLCLALGSYTPVTFAGSWVFNNTGQRQLSYSTIYWSPGYFLGSPTMSVGPGGSYTHSQGWGGGSQSWYGDATATSLLYGTNCTVHWTASGDPDSAGGLMINIDTGSDGPPITATNLVRKWTIKNTTSDYAVFNLYKNGSIMDKAYSVLLAPGQSGDISANLAANDSNTYDVRLLQGTDGFVNYTVQNPDGTTSNQSYWNVTGFSQSQSGSYQVTTITNLSNGTFGTNIVGSVGNTVEVYNPWKYDMTSTNRTGTNAIMVWNATNGIAAQDTTLKDGFSAVVEALTKAKVAAANAHLESMRAMGEIEGSVLGYSNISIRAMVSGFNGLSNMLAQSYGGVTNAPWHGPFTNAPLMTGLGTNYDSAKAMADAAVANFNTTVDAFKNSLQVGSDAAGGFIPVYATLAPNTPEFEFNPLKGDWAIVWQFAKKFAKWLMVAGYLIMIAKDTFAFTKSLALAQQLRMPMINAEFLGIGGNWGVALAPVLLTAIIAAYGVVLGVVGTTISGLGSDVSTFQDSPLAGFTGAVGNGINLLVDIFPVRTMIGLIVAYLTWRLTMTKVGVWASVLVRMLPG